MTEFLMQHRVLSEAWFDQGMKPEHIGLIFAIADLTHDDPEHVKIMVDAYTKEVKSHIFKINGTTVPRAS